MRISMGAAERSRGGRPVDPAASFPAALPLVLRSGPNRLLCLLVLLAASSSAVAHDPGLSSAWAATTTDTLYIRLTLSDRDITGIFEQEPLANADGKTADAMDRSGHALENLARESVVVRNGDTALVPRRAATEVRTGEFVFFLEYDLLSAQPVEIVADILQRLPRGHRMYLALSQTGDDTGDRVLDAENDRVTLSAGK